MTIRFVCAALTAAALLVPGSARAATPAFWQVSTQADFLKGEVVESILVDADGRLALGPASTLVHEAASPFLWTVATAPDGSMFVGAGNEGQVLKVAPDGKTSTFFDAPELEVHALARAANGTLYVATSPDGKIYKVAPDGTSTTFFDPEDKYIWALAVAADGTLYAGTGEKGTVYRIGADGKGTAFYKTKATNVTALALESDGSVLVGTESPGQLLRVSPQGKGFVLLDSPYKEIHTIRLDAGNHIYAVAVSGGGSTDTRSTDRPAPDATTTAPTPTVTTEVTITAIGDVPITTSGPGSGRQEQRRDARGAVFHVAPDGLWDVVWQSNEDSPYDIVLENDRSLLVATGNKGKIFRVSGNPARATLLARADAQQITALYRSPRGDVFCVTSNPGKIYRFSAANGARGEYLSEVRDASTVASWGTLRWRAVVPAGAGVEIATRSGNTRTPDETWSDWSAAYRNPSGDSIVSPKARYLQWRAVLTGKADPPSLTSVLVAYLPRNTRPVVDSITVHPPGVVYQRPFSTGEQELAGFDSGTSDGRATPAGSVAIPAPAGPQPPLGRRTYQRGLQAFVWKASDENDDRLQYDVFVRREGESTWRPLRRGLWDPIFTWDTTSVPDGTYTLRVVASDAPSSSPATTLTGELESTSFDVDNTPPAVVMSSQKAENGRVTLSFVVRDGQSPIQRVEYSTDASRWQVVFPVDGLADSREEQFEVTVDASIAQNVIVRATDALSNVATAALGRR